MACPSPQQFQQRVGRGNGVGSHHTAIQSLKELTLTVANLKY